MPKTRFDICFIPIIFISIVYVYSVYCNFTNCVPPSSLDIAFNPCSSPIEFPSLQNFKTKFCQQSSILSIIPNKMCDHELIEV